MMSYVSHGNTDNSNGSKSRDTRDTKDTQDTWDRRDNFFNSRFEPVCVRRARNHPTKEALKVIIAWAKRRGLTESQRNAIVKTFMHVHSLELSPEDILEILDVPKFTCEFVRNLGFCDEESCAESLSPTDRLIMDTESVLLFHSTSELDVKVAGRREIIPLKKLFKQSKEETKINVALFNEIYLKCYYLPPNPPFDEESALKVYQEWINKAEVIHEAFDPETAIEETVIEIITTKRRFYDLKLLKEGKVPPKRGFFVEDGIIYIDSELFRELLEEEGIHERKEKVARAVRRILADPRRASKRLRLGKENKDRRYFWMFNLRAIQTILRREGDDWTPEILTEDDLFQALKRTVNPESKEDKQENGVTDESEPSDSQDSEEIEVEDWDLSELLKEDGDRNG